MCLKSTANLKRSFSNLSKQIKGANEEIVKRIIVNTHNQIIVNSPVDSGIYRASNFVQEGTTGQSMAESPDSLSDRINEAENIEIEIKGGKQYEFYNNLPYAGPIEAGHSDQAPEGVYSPAADQVAKFIRKNQDEYKKVKFKAVK